MFRISCKTFRSTNLKYQYTLLENNVSFLHPLFGLRTNRSCSFLQLDDKYSIVRSSSAYVNNVLRHDPNYKGLFYNSQTSLPQPENQCETLKTFQRFFANPDTSDFEHLNSILKQELPQLTFEETLDLLYWFLKCSKLNAQKGDWKKMGIDIKSRLDSFEKKPMHKIFQSFDVFYSNPCHGIQFMFHKTIRKVLEKVDKLTPQQFVLGCKYGFHLTSISKCPKITNYSFDRKLQQIFQFLNLDELEIVSSFFLTSHFFFSNFSGKLVVKKLIKNIEDSDAFNHHSIMRVLCKRKVFNFPTDNFANEILAKLSNFNILSLANIFYFSIFSKDSQKIIAQEMIKKYNENFDKCSLTTTQRVLEAASGFGVHNDTFINNVTQRIEKLLEGSSKEYYASFMLNSLFYLINVKIYPENIIKILISQEFCEALISSKLNKVIRNWAFIYYSLKIENPRLVPEIQESILLKIDKVLKYYKAPLTINSTYNQFAYKIERVIENLYGKDKFFWCRVLPHFQPVHVMRFDENGIPQQIPYEFMTQTPYDIKKPTNSQHYWICIFPENTNVFVEDHKFSKLFLTKCRQFKKSGYRIVHIQRKNFNIKTHLEETKELVKNKIDSAIEGVDGL